MAESNSASRGMQISGDSTKFPFGVRNANFEEVRKIRTKNEILSSWEQTNEIKLILSVVRSSFKEPFRYVCVCACGTHAQHEITWSDTRRSRSMVGQRRLVDMTQGGAPPSIRANWHQCDIPQQLK